MNSASTFQTPASVPSPAACDAGAAAAALDTPGVRAATPQGSEPAPGAAAESPEVTSCKGLESSGESSALEDIRSLSPSKKTSKFPGFDSTPLVCPTSRSEGAEQSPASASPSLSPAPLGSSRPAGLSRTPPPQRDKLSGLTRCFNPPKLERKHSSGDLQSRLKTRKILGVGETDNGDIHRSKISQVLGHNEHLYVRLPRGLWVTHVGLAVLVTLECALLLLAPSTAGALGLAPLGGPQCPLTPLRLVGAALSGLAVFVWTAVGTTDKQCARTALVATVLYNALSVAIAVATAAVEGELWAGAATPMAGCRVLVCCLCLAYFRQIVGYHPIRGQRNAFSTRQPGRPSAIKEN